MKNEFPNYHKDIVIDGVSIAVGEQKQINLNIAKLPSRTSIDTPVFVYRSKNPGKTLLLIAGMHGDEVNGVEIIRQLIAKELVIPKRGTVIAIPLLNIYGFLNFSREVPDGKDINRSFPGSKEGSLASRVAHAFTNEILPHIDLGVDFHTGGGRINNFSQLRCLLAEGDNEEYARAFAPHFIINSKLRDKSLRNVAQQMGKSIMVYEGGESQRLNRAPVKEGMRGAVRLMHYLDMIDKEDIAKMRGAERVTEPIILERTSWMRAKFSGLFRSFVKNGSLIEEGQVIGSLTDPFGELHHDIICKQCCHVVAINHQAVVNQGDAIFHLGKTS
ncbi:putative deacylase [Bernardetia litoralis DSM 6794]|uniref:Putative deacylase n=1 Tax=Bernardetia litoralis (strain ATCC 23117 / DSM 6794 / NBRC 15988 / NCIMB 1366 / Fx l1 / Sio-4) TaxID=880071 RepID=I4ALP8_BERLS|nr:succinylglutamate desuccinylase/aspartoacylase family protein [Bernardetia litoralis]AFM04883.1 putative deacylase [Bernardetia litoralis DSM 6794]